MSTLAFVTVEGQYREKRFHEDARGTTFCTDALLAGRNGNVVNVDGYVMQGGHLSAYLVPDTSTVSRKDWRRDATLFLSDISNADGSSHPLCSRSLLRRSVSDLEKLGKTALFGVEVEFFLIPQRLRTQVALQTLPPYDTWRALYGTSSGVAFSDALDEIMALADQCNISVLSVNREYEGFQYEISLAPRDPLTAADDTVLMREIIDFVAIRHNLMACFLPKPFTDQLGSGMHINMSIYSSEGALFALEGNVASAHLMHTMSYLAKHMKACCAIWAPSVNSYRRLGSSDFTGCTPFETTGRRDTLQRVTRDGTSGVRLELRVPDCLANPYISVAICLQGLKAGYEEDEQDNDGGPVALPGLPKSLAEAMDALDTDATIRNSLTSDFYIVYAHLRRAELLYYEEKVSSVDFWFNDHRYVEQIHASPNT